MKKEGKDTPENKKVSQITTAQLNSLLEKIKEITEALEDIEDIVKSEAKKPTTTTDNVIYILPRLINEYDLIRGKSVSLVGVINSLSKWSEEVYIMVCSNKGKFKNRVVKEHISQVIFVLNELKNIIIKKIQDSINSKQ